MTQHPSRGGGLNPAPSDFHCREAFPAACSVRFVRCSFLDESRNILRPGRAAREIDQHQIGASSGRCEGYSAAFASTFFAMVASLSGFCI